ncbi:MAG: ABC transporter ATP-binding protein [Chloroflexi bacterium]|nr:ABC transporter ATP-binding protein [Chloroflexota bacterium]MCI0579926.1 ABC transporter ATP-binding protein [Chloroflexota bacterium]MCI0646509.1 ABC transporter ATP-binding protein [Chloroflexota bacterium]MCI0726139.1 ABC transporter ATP-binding protein [Chloroflexota bacterium]
MSTPVIEVTNLRKLFLAKRSGLFDREEKFVHAIDGVSFTVGRGEVLALVGESGCGKSTLALTLMGLERPTSGSIKIADQEITALNGRGLQTVRRHIQMIFQDPYESLNPMMTIGDIVAEPLLVHKLARNKQERQTRVLRALEDAGLKPAGAFLHRLPHELSGGQRQRVVIAGALVLEPDVLLADEPVSMLDVSIRAEILNLLVELRRARGISILFITHDLGTVGYIADRIAVMYLGRIVELGPAEQILRRPQHPYTKALLSVVPVPNPRQRRERIILQGETPNSVVLPPGCRFHPRCPIAQPRCREIDPQLRLVPAGHVVACVEVEPKLFREDVP